MQVFDLRANHQTGLFTTFGGKQQHYQAAEHCAENGATNKSHGTFHDNHLQFAFSLIVTEEISDYLSIQTTNQRWKRLFQPVMLLGSSRAMRRDRVLVVEVSAASLD